LYNFSQIAAFCNADLKGNFELANNEIDFLLEIDTRKISQANISIFFALKTATRSGEDFLGDAYAKGVRYFVVSRSFTQFGSFPEALFAITDNVLESLQLIATAHRRNIDPPVLGITGSNGKTIVKEWLYSLLSPDLNVVRSPGSYNSQVGVPLSVWKLTNEMDLGIIEAGISKPKEMSRLQNIIRPEVGLLTNIGTAHIENFTSVLEILHEKLTLFKNVKTLVYCKDDDLVNTHVIQFAHESKIQLFSWSANAHADLKVKIIHSETNETLIKCISNGLNFEYKIPFKDKASVQNSIHCIAACLVLSCFRPEILKRMEELTPVEMRMQYMKGLNNCTIINDAYSSDLQSVKVALESLFEVRENQNKSVILSDIPQHGSDLEVIYSDLASLLQYHKVQRCILIGKEITRFSHLFDGEVVTFNTTENFLREFSLQNFRDEVILIKGARAFGFERIAQNLELKNHETLLEINQNAIIHNLNVYKSMIPKGTKIMAMVKAFSYGTGGVEMASLLEFNKVDYLAVAFTDEGVELRNAGIKTPIMVMSPELPAIHKLLEYELEPEVFSFRSLEFLIQALKDANEQESKQIKVHIKIDSGMHRLGFEKADLPILCEKLSRYPNLIVQSVFSHLAASENPEHDQFTYQQANILKESAALLKDKLGYPFMTHILNSAGIERFPDLCLDMVRLGIGIYGIESSSGKGRNLKPALRWKSVISMIKSLSSGETVGYGRRGKITKPSRIATIPVGYADGFSRALGNGVGVVEVDGHLCPTVGNVCMDMIMVDVSATKAEEGDPVIIFGGVQSIEDFAAASATIPYEVLTSISPRVKRVYLKGD